VHRPGERIRKLSDFDVYGDFSSKPTKSSLERRSLGEDVRPGWDGLATTIQDRRPAFRRSLVEFPLTVDTTLAEERYKNRQVLQQQKSQISSYLPPSPDLRCFDFPVVGLLRSTKIRAIIVMVTALSIYAAFRMGGTVWIFHSEAMNSGGVTRVAGLRGGSSGKDLLVG